MILSHCALPGCTKSFVPAKPNQLYCCQQHRQLAYVHDRRQTARTLPSAALSTAEQAEEALGHQSAVDSPPRTPLAAFPGRETTNDRLPRNAAGSADAEADDEDRNGGPTEIVAVLNDRWRVVFRDSPTPEYRQWLLQRSVKGGASWNSVAFCQTRGALLRAIREYAEIDIVEPPRSAERNDGWPFPEPAAGEPQRTALPLSWMSTTVSAGLAIAALLLARVPRTRAERVGQ